MLYLNRQLTQNSLKATLFARSNNAGSAVAVYSATNRADANDINTVSQLLRDWHVEIVGLTTSAALMSTEIRGGIPGGAWHQNMPEQLTKTRFHVQHKDREEAQGDC